MSAQAIRFEVRDARGDLIAVHVRRDRDDGSKSFTWEQPNGTSGLNGLPTSQLPLYGSHEAGGWDTGEAIILVEGEKARDALVRCGFRSLATVTGASSAPEPGPLSVLRGRRVILWPDTDEPGRSHMRRLAETLAPIAEDVSVFDWADAPEHGDAADYLDGDPDAAARLRTELKSTQPATEWLAPSASQASVSGLVTDAFRGLSATPSRDECIEALRGLAQGGGKLDGLQRAGLLHEVAERLKASGLTAREAQDLARAALRVEESPPASRGLQGAALDLQDPLPWPDSPDGSELADEIAAMLARYVVLSQEAIWAVVLWIFFTYALELVDVAPRLLMTSPTKACGKTRLLTVLAVLTRKALPTSSITPAALFRVVESYAPTLLLDEVDNLGLSERPELRALLNSGHTRGTASVVRIEGEEHEARCFSTWCPLAMAAIRGSGLPDTVTSRSIKVLLVRKRKGDQVPRLREDRLRGESGPLRRKLVRWTSDHALELREADPCLPDHLDGRAADNWSVLLSLADALGGDWPARARRAALALEQTASDSDSVGETLLADLRALFEDRAVDRLSSEEMVAALAEFEGRPWAEWGHQRRPISKNQLARLLRAFEIAPRTIRLPSGCTAKGYYGECFEDAWERYLPPSSPSDSSQRHEIGMAQAGVELQSVTGGSAVTDEEQRRAALIAACDGVAVRQATDGPEPDIPPGPLREFLDGLPPGGQTCG